MISIPSVVTSSETRLYLDEDDPGLVYVDLLSPAAAHAGQALRWMALPERQAYLTGEMRFGWGSEGLEAPPGLAPGARLLSVPWEAGPVVAWYRDGDRAQRVAEGITSGFGTSNAILNGTAPLKAMVSPIGVAAELCCRARLSAGRVRCAGRPEVGREALAQAILGESAQWDMTLGEALLDSFKALLGAPNLAAELFVEHASASARKELKELALLEWARRLARWLNPRATLAQPAGQLQLAGDLAPPDFHIDWKPGDLLPLRAVKKAIQRASTAQ